MSWLFSQALAAEYSAALLGWRTVCAVEWDAYAASVFVARQNDGCLPPFPIWDDVQTFDGSPWRGRVDVVSGGLPCTTSPGRKGSRHRRRSQFNVESTWPGSLAKFDPVRFVENSPMLTLRGLDRVLGDLSTLGSDARWGVVGAIDAGAPHRRDRIWIVANAAGARTGRTTERSCSGGLRS
jgi:DNA (cytosine-5)-methyltransferase 1